MTVKKSFSELTAAGQKARLNKYAKARAQYGLVNGLFRMVAGSDHGVKDTKRGKAQSFGYRMVPAGDNNEEGLKDGQYIWMNELIGLKGNAQKVVDARQAWLKRLASKDTKSILVSVDYKVTKKNGKVYRDVHDAFERTTKKATATKPVAKSEDVPF